MASDAARSKVRKFVESYVRKGPYGLYPEQEVVENVIEGLADHLDAHGKMYCPCAPIEESIPQGSEMVCPCTPHRADIARQGYCDCALFASHEFIAAERLAKGAQGHRRGEGQEGET
jgi:ferredoxin-thioredoxin reductase catalytic subunit